MAQIRVDEVFLGGLESQQSYQGRKFEGKIIQEVCQLLGMKKVRRIPYHPQCDGLVDGSTEPAMLDLMAKHVDDNQKNRDTCLPLLLFH